MSETPQGYSGPLPANYVQSSAPQTPNLGLTLTGQDPILAYNFVLIDTAVGGGGGGSVKVNGSTVASANFNGTTPAAPGGSTNVTWQFDGSGNVSAYSASTAPGSPTTSVQFNNSGAFGGSSNLVWDNTNNQLSIGGVSSTTSAALTIIGAAAGNAIVPIEAHSLFANGINLYTHAAAGFRAPVITLYKSRGTQSAPTAIQATDNVGYLGFGGYNGSAYVTSCQITPVATDTFANGPGPYGTDMVFNLVATGGSNLQEVLRLGTTAGGAKTLRMTSGAPITFSTDLNLSRTGAATLGIGNGIAGDVSGTLSTAIVNAGTGFRVANAATSGNVLRGDGTNFVSAQLAFTDISGILGLAKGGTNANLSATGGASQVLKQVSVGAAITVAQLAFTDISGTASANQYVTMIGDSGSGGTKGAVPAPGAGDAAAAKFLKADGTWAAPAGVGTVTSVAMTGDGVIFNSTVTGSPITSAGTLIPALLTQTANTILAGPTSGGAATPTFRALVAGDLPAGATLWSALGNASADLTLANAGFNTTFNQTSAVNWVWANTTAATSGTSQSSPILNVKGKYWDGAASQTDAWAIQDVVANGTNGTSTLVISHTGTSGAASVQIGSSGNVSSITTFGASGGPFTVTTPGNGSQFTWSGNTINIAGNGNYNANTNITLTAVNGLVTLKGLGGSGANFVGVNVLSTGSFTATTGTSQVDFQTTSTFAPTSASIRFTSLIANPTINQTGGANGTIRVLAAYPVNTALVGTEYLLALGTASATGPTGTLTDKFLIDSTGIVANYAATATVGQGVASEIVTVDLTAQTAAITATNLTASAPRTGMYRISWSADITTAGTTSVLGGVNGFQVGYTSPTDSVAKTTVPGNSITSAANTTATAVSGSLSVYAKTGTAITYAFDYTSTGTAMVFELHVRLEAL
jgi:hypothetical protein